MSRLVLLIVSIFIFQSSFAATVYKYVDENGNTVFTDEPRKGAEVLDVQPIPTIPAIKVPPPESTAAPKATFKYNKIVIVSPENQQNFINETDAIVVQVALSPSLRSEDKLQLMLNGAPKGDPVSSTSFTLEQLPRGEYNATVQVMDKDGEVLGSSDGVEFYIKRHSKLMPKPPKPKPKPKS